MEKYKLMKQDYEWLQKIIQTTTSIETLYQKMFSLEVDGKKDTDDYKKLLEYLSISVDVEDELYKNGSLSCSKCIALVEYILNDRVPNGFLNDIESIMTQDYSNRVLRRILNVLVNRIISDYDSIQRMLPSEITDLMEQLGMPNPEQVISQAIYSSIELQKAFEKDTLNGFLAILQEFICKESYRTFREDLIRSKYNTAFINKNIETDMRSNSFEIPETFYTNSRFAADLTQTNLELYKLLKDVYGAKESTNQISRVIEMGDMDYSNPKKAVSSILRQCLMRSSFLLMSDEIISDVNYEFHEFVESEKYLNRHPNDKISEQLIINCFKSIKRDKSKQMVLSFGFR